MKNCVSAADPYMFCMQPDDALGAPASSVVLYEDTGTQNAAIPMARFQGSSCNEHAGCVRYQGVREDTRALQDAIDTCQRGGGGTVYFPPGVYLTGSLHLKSKVSISLSCHMYDPRDRLIR
ncbi:MAG TPA: glycosyl hydrolase family 28-related protein [Acidobacteriota bacterium]|nr:glycosyl hydrolase family 28-related protein [Acidobacteriota bacterium]